MFSHWGGSTCTIKLEIHVHFSLSLSSDLVTSTKLYINTWSLVRFFMVACIFSSSKRSHQGCYHLSGLHMSAYKLRYLDDLEDPPDVGLSSEDEATGMEEVMGVARRVALPRPSPAQPASAPSTSLPTRPATPPGEPCVPESYVKLASDEVIIKKAVLRGIKRGAELALKGQAPASFSLGQAMAQDIPFEVPAPAPHQVHCDICRKDLATPKAFEMSPVGSQRHDPLFVSKVW